MLSDQVTMLNEVLSRYIILRHHIQQAHWLVEGPFFYSWHQMFEEHYNTLNGMIDEFAETLRMHGVLKSKKLALISLEGQEPELSNDKQSGLVNSLLSINQSLKKLVKEIISDSKMSEFFTIIDQLTEHLGSIDKIIWFYQASLASTGNSQY